MHGGSLTKAISALFLPWGGCTGPHLSSPASPGWARRALGCSLPGWGKGGWCARKEGWPNVARGTVPCPGDLPGVKEGIYKGARRSRASPGGTDGRAEDQTWDSGPPCLLSCFLVILKWAKGAWTQPRSGFGATEATAQPAKHALHTSLWSPVAPDPLTCLPLLFTQQRF